MTGTSPRPVLDPVRPQPVDEPQPRYYRVRPRRHRIAAALAVVALALGGGAVLLRGDLTGSAPGRSGAGTGDGFVAPGDVPDLGGVTAGADDPAAPVVAPADVAFDVDSVTVVGDSITEASADAIRVALAAEQVETVDVHGRARRRIEVGDGGGEQPRSGIREIGQLLASGTEPDVWVIALGTNDVGQYPDREAYAGLIDSVLALIPDGAPLVWVDVFRPDATDHTAMFNQVLHERIDDRGDATVAPWHAFASSPGQTILRSDRLHPNERGSEVFAAVVAVGIDDVLDG